MKVGLKKKKKVREKKKERGTSRAERRANLCVRPSSGAGRHLILWKRIIICTIYQMPI